MTVYSALPRVKHLVVVVLLSFDAALILELGEFGGTLLVHNLLEIPAHSAVALGHLAENVRLVALLSERGLNHLVLVGVVLPLNFILHVLPLVLLHPVSLRLLRLVQLDLLFA